jgi:pectate lyase
MRASIATSFLLLLHLAATHAPAAGATLPAFPGAEGFGAGASGGRGGDVYLVTNLNDDGPGSLRDAVSKGNRTVVFEVSGTIELKRRLQISVPNLTIAGQTAPGDGICLRGRELFIRDTSNVIVRFLRVRPGDEAKAELDAITIWNSGDIILDHCSMSWSTDSLNDVVKESGNVTVQWSILSEPLTKSVHGKGAHGYATGWDGRKRGGGSYHHNLVAHASSRAPRLGYYKEGRGRIDVRNNVIYHCGLSYGGEGDDFNFVANYYRPGPTALRRDKSLFRVSAATAKGYFAGNIYEGEDATNRDNRLAIVVEQPRPSTQPTTQPLVPVTQADVLVDRPFEMAPVKTEPAEVAYERVLTHAGAVLPKRDAVDARIVKDVRDRTGALINSPSDVGGWPELKSAPAPADRDRDGLPDAWEAARGLNPDDPSDQAKPSPNAGGYTNLEVYLNHLAAGAFDRRS